MAVALEAGADDMTREGDLFEIIIDPAKFSAVLEAIRAANVETVEAEVKYLPKMQKDLDLETGRKVMKFIDALDDHDDVQNVYTDANLTEEMAAE
jgi:transcriptional/translational regulatory protein YebC/TACO1